MAIVTLREKLTLREALRVNRKISELPNQADTYGPVDLRVGVEQRQ
jgi:hypothetical protein